MTVTRICQRPLGSCEGDATFEHPEPFLQMLLRDKPTSQGAEQKEARQQHEEFPRSADKGCILCFLSADDLLHGQPQSRAESSPQEQGHRPHHGCATFEHLLEIKNVQTGQPIIQLSSCWPQHERACGIESASSTATVSPSETPPTDSVSLSPGTCWSVFKNRHSVEAPGKEVSTCLNLHPKAQNGELIERTYDYVIACQIVKISSQGRTTQLLFLVERGKEVQDWHKQKMAKSIARIQWWEVAREEQS